MKNILIIIAVLSVFFPNVKAEAICTISEKRMNINHEYFKGTIYTPVLELDEKTIAEQWNQTIDSYQNEFLKVYQQEAISKSKSPSIHHSNQFPYYVTISYSISFCNRHYISIVSSNEIKKGELEQRVFQKAYNLQVKSGEEITLLHMFQNKDKAIATIKDRVIEIMNKDRSRYNRLSIEVVRKMTQFSFYIEKDNLTVYVPESALETEREGVSEFKIPFSQFSQNINNQFMEKLNQR